MQDRGKSPRRLGELISEVLRNSGAARRDDRRRLAEAWILSVGTEAAKRSRVVSLQNGLLTVTVESAALRQELQTFRRDEVLGRMREAFSGRRITSLKCILT